jgi:hypothetical protein
VDPITLAIVTAIAAKGAESVGQQAGPALKMLVAKVLTKLAGHPALAAAQESPASDEQLETLSATVQADPELRSLWQQARSEVTATRDGVANTFFGQAEKVVQLRDVHGDLNIS